MSGSGRADGLDGASGHVFRVDPVARSFELLKETEYDPRSEIGKSRFTVHWDDQTEIVKTGEASDFSAIQGPVSVEFRGIDAANRKALADRRAFVARVATVFLGDPGEAEVIFSEDGNGLTAPFVPDPSAPRSGVIELNGKSVPVSLRPRNWKIFTRAPLPAADLAGGFWKVTLRGRQDGDRFVASLMEVENLPDPRANDDPDLPRVLVIGDSISMNYHDQARMALAGVANYHRIEGNAFTSGHGVRNAELWLGEYQRPGFGWDVIQFNHGLHDLKQAYDEKTGEFGDYAVAPADYQMSLEKLIGILERTGARLIWCTTTPVPNDRKGPYARRKGAAKVFNDAALEVMKRHPNIAITDLHGLIDGSPVFDAWRMGDDVHFHRQEELELLGRAVAEGIREALAGEGE